MDKIKWFVQDQLKRNWKKMIAFWIAWKIFVTLGYLQYKSCTKVEVLPPKQMDNKQSVDTLCIDNYNE